MESRGQGYKKIRECRGQGQKWQCQVEVMERCVIESRGQGEEKLFKVEVKERKGHKEQRLG